MTDATTMTPSLNKALSVLQGELPTFADDKQREVTVEHKDGTSHSYKYVTLNTIMEVVGPLMAKHGLSFSAMPGYHDPGDGKIAFSLLYRLAHVSGEVLTGLFPLPGGDGQATQGLRIQAMGTAIAYARRYCLAALLGVTWAQDDDDGQAAEALADADQTPATARRRATQTARTEQAAANTERVRRRREQPQDEPPPAEPSEYRDPSLPVATGTLGHIFGLFAKLGYGQRNDETRAERLRISADLLGRAVPSSKDMTSGEAQGLIDVLQACVDAGDAVEDRRAALGAAVEAARAANAAEGSQE